MQGLSPILNSLLKDVEEAGLRIEISNNNNNNIFVDKVGQEAH